MVMAGNSQRRGAVRKAGTKKGATVGTGGHGRRALEGKGPTPKAEDRPYHPAAKRQAAAQRQAAQRHRAPERGRGRTEVAADVVAGRNPVLEALRAGVPATRLEVAVRAETDPRLREILRLAADRGLPIMQVTATELDKRTGVRHQGVALSVAEYQYATLRDLLTRADDAGRPAFIVALDGVTDPHNLGAVIRSAAAFGAHGVLIPSRRAAGVTATAWKVSAGTAAHLPVARTPGLVQGLREAKAAGCYVIGLDGEGALDLAHTDLLTEPVVLVVGSEGKGLGRLVRETCDATARIDITAAAESLNAAVAAGIAAYEVHQARRRATAA
jgi:23S rRNA (guanosine2251-2'-O)-methyltransferase